MAPGLVGAVRGYIGRQQELRAAEEKNRREYMGVPLPKMTELPKPPETKTTDFMESFGSAAMALAGLGSLMTRRPLTNALNAGAAVMQAYHKNDMEAAQQAYQKWEVETKNAMAMHQFEQETYRNVMDKHRGNADMLRAALTANAAALKDEVALAMLNSGNTPGAIALITGRAALGGRIGSAQEELQWRQQMSVRLAKVNAMPAGPEKDAALAEARQAVEQRAMVEDPRGFVKAGQKTPSPNQIYVDAAQAAAKRDAAAKGIKEGTPEYQELLAKKLTEVKPLPETEVAKYQEANSQATMALDHADSVLNIINSTPFAVGGGGILVRPLEAIGNILGSDGTARSEFIRELDKLSQAYSRVMQSPLTAGRPLASQQKVIDEIIGGRGWGQTAKNTVDAIRAIQNDLYRRKQDVDARLNKTWKPDMSYDELPGVEWGGGKGNAAPTATSFDQFPTIAGQD